MFGICNETGTEIIARFVTPMTVRSNQPIYSSDTLSLKRQTTRRTAQRWEIETNLEPLTSSANRLFVDIVSKGYDETVYVLMPQNVGVIYNRGGLQEVSASKVDSNTLAITNNEQNFIPTGTFFQVKNGSTQKIYITTTNLQGNGNVSIYPSIYSSFASGYIKIHNNVIGKFLYDLDTLRGMSFTDGILMDNGTIKLVEKL